MATFASVSSLFQSAPDSRARPLAIARWLELVAVLVVMIVVVGGITRLTESGLSITEWNVVSGILPPLSEAAWQAEFAKYRATAEFRYESGPAGLDLAAFKFIFFWEWFHRILGRVIGLAFLLPLIVFALRRAIPAGYGWRLAAMFSLILGQGALGWYMVSSGVGQTDLTDVSHFRLSAHLLTALFLRHFPALVNAGHVFVAMPPLFRVDVGKQVFYALDEEEKRILLEKIEREKIRGAVNVTRFKGLGEMNPSQLRESTIHPDTRRLVQLTVDDNAETHSLMDMLLAKKRASDRKTWLETKGDLASLEI